MTVANNKTQAMMIYTPHVPSLHNHRDSENKGDALLSVDLLTPKAALEKMK